MSIIVLTKIMIVNFFLKWPILIMVQLMRKHHNLVLTRDIVHGPQTRTQGVQVSSCEPPFEINDIHNMPSYK